MLIGVVIAIDLHQSLKMLKLKLEKRIIILNSEKLILMV